MCKDCNNLTALRLAEEVEELADAISEKFFHDNPTAMEFADSIKEKATSMADWIEKNEHVTKGQLSALTNMKKGAERWLE